MRRLRASELRQAQRVLTRQPVFQPYASLVEHARAFNRARAERNKAAAKQRVVIRRALRDGYDPGLIAYTFNVAPSEVRRLNQQRRRTTDVPDGP